MAASSSGSGGRSRRAPRAISAAYLQRVTAHYFERYATTRGHLRALLMQRVWRAAEHHQRPVGPWEALVEAELDRLEEIGVLNDALWAQDRAATLARRGAGQRKIRAALTAKRVPSAIIDQVLQAQRQGDAHAELRAACVLAHRRRLGPWRRAEIDGEGRRKELNKLGRAGFSWEIAQQVVDAESVEALQAVWEA